ncbi:unnamed protein product [Psylliodes chrysocephalus]|uniref:TAR DNA-binding protein 43 n=1 Tax=Psylliodes chrysocephalus TaxID=3402493 RepID=A0A9P0G6Y8_9CUCU|nr:unnamed protein product [Psylliodes chrysocephala]
MTVEFLQVCEEEGDDPIELPTEENGTLLLSTVAAQFPGALGLKYKANADSKTYRGVRLSDGVLHPPPDGGWESKLFVCSFPKENKRKVDDDSAENSSASKTKRLESSRCTDLIVLGLAWKTDEKELQTYFEKYGDLLVAQVKKDRDGNSKGFGFIRFGQYESQMRVLGQRHMIDGRWCDVKIPSSKEGVIQQLSSRVFVGRCTEDMSLDDLKEYFGKFGEVTDVFMPKPFRAFCFVTFLDPEVAQKLCGEDHIIKGVSVHVSNAAPKQDNRKHFNNDRSGGNRDGPVWSDSQGSGGGGNSRYNDTGPNNWGGNQGGFRGGNNMDASNFNPLMNPALMAAALNQAGWGFMGGGNMGGGGGNQDSGYSGGGGGGFNNGSGGGPNNNNRKFQNGNGRNNYSDGGPWGGNRPQNRGGGGGNNNNNRW